MRTTISGGQESGNHGTMEPWNHGTMDNCFGFVRPHQHCKAYTCRDVFLNLFKRQLHAPNVIAVVGDSISVLPRLVYGEVDPVTSDLSDFSFQL